jgi:hypothetical protein
VGAMQGKTLLDRLKGGDVVIITQLDRLFRVALDTPGLLAELKEHGISLDVIDLGGDVTGDGISKLVFIFTTSSWAAAERERLAAIRRCQQARGGYRGGIPPFGWRVGDGGALVKVPEQQEALPRMHRLRADGTPFRAIAEQMVVVAEASADVTPRACEDHCRFARNAKRDPGRARHRMVAHHGVRDCEGREHLARAWQCIVTASARFGQTARACRLGFGHTCRTPSSRRAAEPAATRTIAAYLPPLAGCCACLAHPR